MDLRFAFNEDVINYDKMRPTYVKELYDEIFSFSKVGQGASALEIGIGTGQATLPFLDRGCFVTAVELGSNLAAFSKAKYSGYKNFNVINADFESVVLENDSFDLIYAATAFHWLPQETGYPKAYRLLKKHGTLALFWNHPSRPHDAFHFAMQKVYDKYMPSGGGKSTVHSFSEENCLKIAATLRQYGFVNVCYRIYNQTRYFDADGYIALLNTYSDHRALARDQWKLFEKDLRDVISNHGGRVDIHDTMDLYLAEKP